MTARRRRALDVSCGVGAAYAAKLLAELDWDVVKYEPAAGDPLRARVSRWGGGAGGAFAFVNQGKRGVSGDHLVALAAAADVVIGDFSPPGLADAGLDPKTADALAPCGAGRRVGLRVRPDPAQGVLGGQRLHRPGRQRAALHDRRVGPAAPADGARPGRPARRGDRGQRRHPGRRPRPPHRHPPVRRHLHDRDPDLVRLQRRQPIRAPRRGRQRREQRIKGNPSLRMVPAADRFVYCAPGAVAAMRMDGIAELLAEPPRLAEDRFQTAEGRMQNWDEFVALFAPPFGPGPRRSGSSGPRPCT